MFCMCFVVVLFAWVVSFCVVFGVFCYDVFVFNFLPCLAGVGCC